MNTFRLPRLTSSPHKLTPDAMHLADPALPLADARKERFAQLHRRGFGAHRGAGEAGREADEATQTRGRQCSTIMKAAKSAGS